MSKLYEISYLDIQEDSKYKNIVDKVINQCYKTEGLLESKLHIEIILTTPKNIKEMNKKYRDIDKETDVLSFPMFEKKEIEQMIKKKEFEEDDILGDMVISIKKVEEQAKEYGHSFEREFAYMIVHSFYHLMGYDHIKEEEKEQMRKKEEKILSILKIDRKS